MSDAPSRTLFSRIGLRPDPYADAFPDEAWEAAGQRFGVAMPRPFMDLVRHFGAGQFASETSGGLDQFMIFSPDAEGGHGSIRDNRVSMDRVRGILAVWRDDGLAAKQWGDRKAVPFAEVHLGPRFYLAFGPGGAFRGVMRREADTGTMSLATFAGFLALLEREAAGAPDDGDGPFKAAERRWLALYGDEAGS